MNPLFDLHDRSSSQTRVHLVGICGAGMKALAEVLAESGCHVSGSDREPDPGVVDALKRRGIRVRCGHHPAHLPDRLDLLLYSAAIGSENPERQAACDLGVPQWSYVEALAGLMQGRRGIAVAGTHGKSTTTALLGGILGHAGADPTVICGAESRQDRRSGRLGKSDLMVVEACEYRRHFLHLSPELVCLLGIEPDHFDCYPAFDDAIEAYREFINRVPSRGVVIYRSDCLTTNRIVREIAARKVSFSLTDPRADWLATEQPGEPGTVSPDYRARSPSGIFALRLTSPGRHHVLNALAASAAAFELGIPLPEIAAGLTAFSGLRRRFEIVGCRWGGLVIDDYAHHPSEITATLSAARRAYAPGRLVCVFQPHQVSRTRSLLPEFGTSLLAADAVYVLPVYGAREQTVDLNGPLARELVTEIRRRGGSARFLPALDRVWATLETDARAGDLILTLGAGDIARIHDELT